MDDPDITNVYDPQLTVIDGRVRMFCGGYEPWASGGIAVTDDFQR
ncbi:MAG: hypothetical protein ACLTDS_02380 [Bianqueaceae bacterium]